MYANSYYSTLMHRIGLIAALVYCSFLYSACEPPWPKCDSDKNCIAKKEGNTAGKTYFCVNGTCQECRNVADCGDPKRNICENNRCREKTCADVKCDDSRKRCDSTTLACKWICENDGDANCDGDPCKVCKNHACVAKQPKCSRDTDCPGAQSVCQSAGQCQAQCVSGCSSAKPCPSGKKCINGQCQVDSCNMSTVYFNFNRSSIRSDAKSTLSTNNDCIKKTTGKKVLIEGHADERGTTEYNIALSRRRAVSVKAYLQRLGASSGFCIVPKGKSDPAVSNASSEEDHQKNRRAVFSFVDSCP